MSRGSSALSGSPADYRRRITVDNGTEFTSKALEHWATGTESNSTSVGRGSPSTKMFIEVFGTFRRECLASHWFLRLDDLQRTLQTLQDDYNGGSALGRRQIDEHLVDGLSRPTEVELDSVPVAQCSSAFDVNSVPLS